MDSSHEVIKTAKNPKHALEFIRSKLYPKTSFDKSILYYMKNSPQKDNIRPTWFHVFAFLQ